MLTRIARNLIVVAGVCASSITYSGEPTVTNPLLSKPRPWCVGRFVFNRPATSEISNQRYEFRGEKLETQYKTSLDVYQSKVENLEKDLKSKQRVNPINLEEKTGFSWLEKTISPTKDSKVFVFQKGVAKGVSLPFHTEGYLYDNHTLFHTTGSIGETALNDADGIYRDVYRRIKARDNWSVPTESGFCFDGGIVTGSSTYPEEVSQSFALMPGRPALLVIQMRDSVRQDQGKPLTKTLPELRAQMDRVAGGGSYRILRQGKRTVGGVDGEEVLFELKDGPITSYRFYLLAPGDPSTLARPHTAIQLLLGAPSPDLPPDQATSPVDEAGALQTWDTLLNSLRLRPGAV